MPSVGVPATSPKSIFRRIVFGLILIVLTLAVAGFLYENISEARDRRFNPMPGRLVDVNGHRMHIDCAGEGVPAVILDSGLGDSYISWRKCNRKSRNSSGFVRTIEADLGYSDSTSAPRTSKAIAEELHALLAAAGVAPPYVLVGHSMAGYDVRLFASLYRNEVAGMVLVDASHPEQEHRFPPEIRNLEGSWRREAEFMEYTMPFGIPRLMGLCDEDIRQRAAECNWRNAREGAAEMKSFPESAAQAAATGSFGDMPLAVLSHDPDKPSSELPPELAKPTNDAWEKMQEDLAHLSTRGTQAIAKNSAHYIQSDRPDIVIEAVHSVVEQARQAQSASQPSH